MEEKLPSHFPALCVIIFFGGSPSARWRWHALRYSEGRAYGPLLSTPFGVPQGVPPNAINTEVDYGFTTGELANSGKRGKLAHRRRGLRPNGYPAAAEGAGHRSDYSGQP